MKIAEIIDLHGVQVVKLPEEFRFSGPRVSIRREGDAVILAPINPVVWPPDFFEEIHIEDPAFARLSQGHTPPALTLS